MATSINTLSRRSFVKAAALAGTAALAAGSLGTGAALADAKGDEERVTVRLGVVGAIYEDIWTPAKEKLAEEGIDLEFVQFSDYVTPNNALDNGDIDLNAFQHRIYLANEVEEYGYAIENIGNTFIIPLNLYSQKVSSVDELQAGDTVAIPNDPTNGGRALKVLEAAGLIQIAEEAGFNPTVDDIEVYNTDVTIVELAANVLPSSLADVTAAIVNGNYALDFGLKTEEAIYQDTVLDEKEYWNLVAARTADVEDPEKLALYQQVVDAFQTDETEEVFAENFGGYFVAVGWGESPLDEEDEDEEEPEEGAKADEADAKDAEDGAKK
jgi:D-methionine transport system substrate-binding protein